MQGSVLHLLKTISNCQKTEKHNNRSNKGAKEMMDANNRKTIKQMNQHGNNTQAEKHSTLFTMQIKPLKWNITFYWCESKDNHHSTSKQIAKPLSQTLVNSIHLWISLIHLINYLIWPCFTGHTSCYYFLFKAESKPALSFLKLLKCIPWACSLFTMRI